MLHQVMQELQTNGKPVKVGDTDYYYYDLTYTVKNNKLFDMPEAGGGFQGNTLWYCNYDYRRRLVHHSQKTKNRIILYNIFHSNIPGLIRPVYIKDTQRQTILCFKNNKGSGERI